MKKQVEELVLVSRERSIMHLCAHRGDFLRRERGLERVQKEQQLSVTAPF